MLNYLITEDDFNGLDTVRGQLNMVASLLTGQKANAADVGNPADLGEFLFAHVTTIKGILSATEARHAELRMQSSVEQSQPAGNVLSGADLADIFSLLSGQAPLAKGRVKELGCLLLEFAQRDRSLKPMLTAWLTAVTDNCRLDLELTPAADDDVLMHFASKQPTTAPKETAAKRPATKRRERLAATAGAR